MTFLDRRLLGFRAIDVLLFLVLVALILGVYLAKTLAGRERGQIATVEREIAQERDRIVLLEAEVAHLERPERLSAMACATNSWPSRTPSRATKRSPGSRLRVSMETPCAWKAREARPPVAFARLAAVQSERRVIRSPLGLKGFLRRHRRAV